MTPDKAYQEYCAYCHQVGATPIPYEEWSLDTSEEGYSDGQKIR